MGARVLLLEGGAELNRALLEHDAVDEYFLSIGPVLVGGRHGLSAVGGDDGWPLDEVRLLELLSAVPNPATNEIYTRWRIKHS
jgi:2,5-diamino-6-(ribosylamino)-4(3H)-pyrimidinone 5'-phosphate reductase